MTDTSTLITLPRLIWLGAVILCTCVLLRLGCRSEEQEVISNAKPLIAAIEQFKEKRGSYPDNLESLMPDFIAEIPKTSSSDFPKFIYSKDDSIAKFTGGYELRAPMPFDPDTDVGKALVYWPTGKYPSDLHGHGVSAEVSDHWAYYYSDSSEVPPAKDLLRYPIN